METSQKLLIVIGVFFFFYIMNGIVYRLLVWKHVHKSISKEINDVLTKDEYKVKGKFE